MAMSVNDAVPAERPARLPFTRRGPFHALVVMVGWLLVSAVAVVLGTVAGLVVMQADPDDVRSLGFDYPWVVTNALAISAITLILSSLHMGFVVGEGDRRVGLGNVPIQRPGLMLGLALSATVMTWATASLLGATDPLNLTGVLESAGADVAPAWPWLLPVCNAVILVILVPLGDELFFRGWLWVTLRRVWSVPVVIAATALPFWLLHPDAQWRYLVALIPSTLAFSLVRHYCGSVRASVAAHVIHHAISVALIFALMALGD